MAVPETRIVSEALPPNCYNLLVMINPITVRFATRDDLTFVSAKGDLSPDLSPKIVQRKIDWHEVLVAERSGEPIGYAYLEYLWSKIPYLALIWVIEGQRRSGAGRALLRFLEDFLHAHGHRFLYSSSQVDEPEPQAWHRHVGFVECGIIAGLNPKGVGEVFFRKRLG